MDSDGRTVCILRFDGSLTVRDVEAHHARLAAALREHPAVTVDVAGCTEADMAFVQLLIAGCRTAQAQGAAFALAAPAGGPLLDALVRGGLVAADPAARGDTFWTKGSEEP